jgi:hypothetical protein
MSQFGHRRHHSLLALIAAATPRRDDRGRRTAHRGRHPRRPRRLHVLIAVGAGLVAAYFGITLAYFVESTLGVVPRPQVVVVLDGYGNRDARGIAIALADHVPTLAVSWPPYASCPPPRSDLLILCFVPNPVSTQGEARAVARLARLHHWNRLVVVAGTTQIVRARLYLERCYSGRIAFNGVDPTGFFDWMYEIGYSQIALARALVWQSGC